MEQADFQAHIIKQQRELINDPLHSDVLLTVAGDKKIHAHKHILAKFSEYYRAAFNEQWKQNKTENGKQIIVTHPAIHEDIMFFILEYMYAGCGLNIPHEKVSEVYLAADFLNLDDLMVYCEGRLNEDNALDLFHVAFKLGQVSLVQSCIPLLNFISMEPENLASFSIEQLYTILNSLHNKINDLDLWCLVEVYGKAFSPKSILDDVALVKILDLLNYSLKQFFVFQFDASQYSRILERVNNAEPKTKSKLESIFKHYSIKNQTFSSKFQPSSKIFDDPSLFSSIIDQLSYIIKVSHFDDIHEISWKLLFRASENDFKAKAFHESCAEKGPTVTIVKANDRYAAAYNCDSWQTATTEKLYYTLNKYGFIASIGDEKVTIFRKNDHKINGANTAHYQGPTFGDAYARDLKIHDSCNKNKLSYSVLGNSYVIVKEEKENEEDAEDDDEGEEEEDVTSLFGKQNFKVQEYEVFGISFE